MAFEEVPMGRMGSSPSQRTGVACSITGQGSGDGGAARGDALAVTVYADVLDRLGWQLGVRVRVAEGVGPDRGLLAFTATPTDGFKLYLRAGEESGAVRAAMIKFSLTKFQHYRVVPPGRKAATRCEFQAFGGRLLVMAPEWLQLGEAQKVAAE